LVLLGVVKEIQNPSNIYDGYSTPGTYWLSGDYIEVFRNSDTLRVIQRVTQTSSAGGTGACWFRVLVGNTWSKPRLLTLT